MVRRRLAPRKRPVFALLVVVACGASGFAAAGEPPTYNGKIAAILRRHCFECHRPGRVGPFPLANYEQARKRAGDIAAVVAERRMPPWKPAPGVGPKLKGDRSLAAADIAALSAWSRAGAPLGDPAAILTAVAEEPEGWTLGTPDLILAPAEEFVIPAVGEDIYRCFVIPTDLPRDVYIAAVEYRPGNRRVVHHITTFVDTGGEGRVKDAAAPGPGYPCPAGSGVAAHGDLGGWAPGNEPCRLPEGVGRSLPRRADVILQVHYHPSGKPERDRTRIGLYFCRMPVKQTLQWNGAANLDFRLAAGNPKIDVRAEWYVPVDVVALAVAPHMHRLGRDLAMSVKFPDGRIEQLIDIPAWDFGWQGTYYFERPIDLPRGSVVRVRAHFDNSKDNPLNPNHPPRAVTWGEGSRDEMCVGYIAVVKKGQDLTRPGELDDLFETFVRQRRESLDARPNGGRQSPR
jgi:hypothetical protein